jgi:HD-like signal output (HDOD) protein
MVAAKSMTLVRNGPANFAKASGAAFGTIVARCIDMDVDERAWLGDPAAQTRKNRVPGSAAACAARVNGARPFPAAAAKVLTLTGSADFDVHAVIAAIESDAALASRVLRLINMVAFGLRSRCSSIRHAVVLLGSVGVREAVIAGSVLNMFPGGRTEVFAKLQEHAMNAGVLARHLAPEWKLPADELFTAAFLHDIGKWFLLEEEPEYESVLAEHGQKPEGTLDEERGRFGFDHAELAEHLLEAWKLPAPVPRLVGLHHDPAEGYAQQGGLAVRVALLRLANRLAHDIMSGVEPDFDEMANVEPATYLGLSAQALRDRYPALVARIQADEQSTTPPQALSAGPASITPAEEDVCAFCDNAAFGVHCTKCDILLCQGHRVGRGTPVCERCEDLFRHELAEHRVLDLPMSLIVIGAALGFALLAAAARGYAWGALPFALGLFGWAVHNMRRRLQLRRSFLRATRTTAPPTPSLYPPRPSSAPGA